MAKASACARAEKPKAEIHTERPEVLAFGQRASARVSYLGSTRAKAPLNPNPTVHSYTGKLTHIAPGLTECQRYNSGG